YGIRALAEGRADVAQLFFEAAGAETIHALEHLRTMGAVGSTRENLLVAATGEMQEIDVTLPRMIREAEEDGRPDAAASFRLALEARGHPAALSGPAPSRVAGGAAGAAPPAPPAFAAPAAAAAPASAKTSTPVTVPRTPAAVRTGGVTAATMRRMDGRP